MADKITLKSNRKSIKRVGRGVSAGGGKTAGRGTKGQNSRAGHNIPNRHEGGQTPLSMRLPKLPGFKKTTKKPTILTLDIISLNYKDGETISVETLERKGLIKKGQRVKILNSGKLSVKVKLENIPASKSVISLISSEKPKN